MRSTLGLVLVILSLSAACAQKKPVVFDLFQGKVSATLPSSPKLDTQEFATGKFTVQIHSAKCEVANDLILSVSYTEYPNDFKDLQAKTIFDGLREGLKNPDGRVESESEITLGEKKIPGREFKIEAGKKVVRARVFMTGQRVYQVLAVGTKDSIAKASVEEMFKTFQIKE